MADERKTKRAGDRPPPARRAPTPNRVQWLAIGGLMFLLLIGGLVCSGKKAKTKAPPDQGARTLVVPGDRARTIVVPACGTGMRITARNAPAQIKTPGSTAFGLPPGRGTRAVVVPRCSSRGGSESASGAPSAAYVMPTGEAKASGQSPGAAPPAARSTLIVPDGSAAETVVVPPCTKAPGPERTVVLGAKPAGSRTAVAPSC